MITKASSFGKDFIWGAATASYQIEGAWDVDGKSLSIWDTFASKKGKIKDKSDGKLACDFYHRYPEDIAIMKSLGLDAFRFSLAWTRILPEGGGRVNQKGIDFYKRVIEACLERGVQPWVTLYHWDLPQCLQDKGGWRNRDIIDQMGEYTDVCTRAFGDTVQNWMIFNEPSVFTSAGYMLGVHAPGERGWFSHLQAVHHVAMAQAAAGRVAKSNLPNANIGTTFSMTQVEPYTNSELDIRAADRVDAFINRMFLDPLLGKGYPFASNKYLRHIERYMHEGDEQILQHDFDFIGLQTYTRTVIQHKWWVPFVQALPVSMKKLKPQGITEMGWEVYPEGIYYLLKKLHAYDNMPPLYVTENGAALPEQKLVDRVEDPLRVKYLQDYIHQVYRAKSEGVDVRGYFIWSLLDNFEWAEGYRPRFGIVHVDYATQGRTIKDSGRWIKDWLSER